MAMEVNNWYMDPAQRYNDVIYPQQERKQYDKGPSRRGAHERDWKHHGPKAEAPEKAESAKAQELSPAAQKLLDKLKKTYGNVDFMVAGSDTGEQAKKMLAGGTGKYSVLFTNEELEQMAADEKYQKSMIDKMHEGFQRTATESSKMGLKAIDGGLRSVGIRYGKDGTSSMFKEMAPGMDRTMTMFSEMEKGMDAQRTRMEELHGKRAAGKKGHGKSRF